MRALMIPASIKDRLTCGKCVGKTFEERKLEEAHLEGSVGEESLQAESQDGYFAGYGCRSPAQSQRRLRRGEESAFLTSRKTSSINLPGERYSWAKCVSCAGFLVNQQRPRDQRHAPTLS